MPFCKGLELPRYCKHNTIPLCAEQPRSLEQLAELLNRSVDLVRKNYLQPLVRAKRLRYQYPTRPNHPQQMYITEDKH